MSFCSGILYDERRRLTRKSSVHISDLYGRCIERLCFFTSILYALRELFLLLSTVTGSIHVYLVTKYGYCSFDYIFGIRFDLGNWGILSSLKAINMKRLMRNDGHYRLVSCVLITASRFAFARLSGHCTGGRVLTWRWKTRAPTL